MPQAIEHDLWKLALSAGPVDASQLAEAVELQAMDQSSLDFRTRLLIRDSVDAIGKYWGQSRLENWLTSSPAGTTIRSLQLADLGPPGFSLLSHRIMDATKSDSVMEFLRELGLAIAAPEKIEIGGAIALIIAGVLSRRTEDIDIVDEVPASIRNEHDLLRRLAGRYGLQLTHFQSHFLPEGWRNRIRGLGRLGKLDVFVVDPLDIFVGKLFSAREKDRDDLRALARVLGKNEIEDRLKTSAKSLAAQKSLAAHAADNWYILFGETLPN